MKSNEKPNPAQTNDLPEIPLEYAMLVEFFLWNMCRLKDKERRNSQCVVLFGALRASMVVGLIPVESYFQAVGIACNVVELYTLGEEEDDRTGHFINSLMACFGPVVVHAGKLDKAALTTFLHDFLGVAGRMLRADRRLYRIGADKTEIKSISAGTQYQLIGMLWGGQTLGLFSKEQMFQMQDEVVALTNKDWLIKNASYDAVGRVFELDEAFRQVEIAAGRYQPDPPDEPQEMAKGFANFM